ncbi:MAG: Rrf2 family transcriptional regulator [Desulfobulbaceae bacterium]|jgi:Rrf2 family protein|nr:Rrf2 family transcriptional regulator [Desulfobulbaceae bacterium]MDY0351821.1 Rrf2 family transcriptional regulator [Desulfobulbaceae bacterium]
MRLTRAAEYAIRCVLYLAKMGPGRLASRKDIAEYAEIPPPFLAKIAQDLARAGLIEIRQGAKGGFVLLKDPKEITLLEVVETMIGEIYLNDCVARPSSCNALEACGVHRVWLQARNQLRETLRRATFDTLVRDRLCIRISNGRKENGADPKGLLANH